MSVWACLVMRRIFFTTELVRTKSRAVALFAREKDETQDCQRCVHCVRLHIEVKHESGCEHFESFAPKSDCRVPDKKSMYVKSAKRLLPTKWLLP